MPIHWARPVERSAASLTKGVATTLGEQLLFGPFRLILSQQLLLEADSRVAIGTRAFDLLVLLASHAGEVVSKKDILASVWHGLSVEEGSVRVHVANLRRALRDGEAGARYIVNLPGRGYSFIAPVTRVGIGGPVGDPDDRMAARRTALPRSAGRVIGRTVLIDMLCSLMAQQRFITLVGSGGIGKTTVAVAVAHRLSLDYPDGCCFVDFSPLRDAGLVAATVASALGLAIPFRNAMPAITAHLGRRNLLLVLDNCEHVVETAADVAEQISSSAQAVHIIATSREPLRATGERVHRLSPLASPPPSVGLTAEEALSFPSVQLFMERYSATMDGAGIDDANAVLVADICRRLDGIALAIELAAARVPAFGLQELAARLDDRFRLLTAGRRTAIPRHQTLSAMLEWSYHLLSASEQLMLRRVSIFPGKFSLEDATSMMADVEQTEVVERLAELVAKSLISTDRSPGRVHYLLMETTRLFCAEKVRDRGEFPAIARIHAEHVVAVLLAAEAELASMQARQWRAKYASVMADARAALDWSDGADGDGELYVRLTIAAVPLWAQLSSMEECRRRVERALSMGEGQDRAVTVARMRLMAALGWSLMYAAGRAEEIGAAWAATLELAEALDDESHRLRAIWGLWVSKVSHGELEAAFVLANRLLDLVRGSSNDADLMVADRLMATTLHFRGDQNDARVVMDRMFARHAVARSQPTIAPFYVDQKVTAQSFRARILWLQGHVDQAWEAVLETIRDGEALGHALSFASVLGQAACPIALLRGDTAAARRYATMLLDYTEYYALPLWSDWARCFGGLVSIREGQVNEGLDMMRAAFGEAGDNRLLPRYMLLIGEYAACAGQAGSASAGIETVDAMLVRCKRTNERWYEPEMRRIRGELLARSDLPGSVASVEAEFLQAIRLSARQGSRSWQLRAALSLARFRHGAGATAGEPLATIFGNFTEGFSTTDLQQASELLSSLQ